jgi:hypothetical protein
MIGFSLIKPPAAWLPLAMSLANPDLGSGCATLALHRLRLPNLRLQKLGYEESEIPGLT